jgi:hypothetical protein
MRADRLAHIGPDQRRNPAAADADGEMVGPEPDQALAERRRRVDRVVFQRLGLGLEDQSRAARLTRRRHVDAILSQRLERVGDGCTRRPGVLAVKLVREPLPDIGGVGVGRRAAEAET